MWAGLADTRLPIDVSLEILDSVHARWDAVNRALTPAQFERTFVHPELNTSLTLDAQVQLYAWHSKHHVAHVTGLRQRQRW
jgi:hypothetical protein